jgi:cell wall-associated NlpC family hydrolase
VVPLTPPLGGVPLGPEESSAVDIPGSITQTSRLVREALDLRGTPYRNGGSDPSGFDCSGFTQWVFARVGVWLPRETRDQFQMGQPVRADTAQAGDLIFFSTTTRGASHVGISLGGDTFVHAPSSRGVVRVESLDVPYWSQRIVGVRRVADEARETR